MQTARPSATSCGLRSPGEGTDIVQITNKLLLSVLFFAWCSLDARATEPETHRLRQHCDASVPAASTASGLPRLDQQIAPLGSPAGQNSSAVLANTFSKKFHRPHCEFALAMRKSRRYWFSAATVATVEHFSPCRWCFPFFTTSVAGRLLTPLPQKTTSVQSCTPPLTDKQEIEISK